MIKRLMIIGASGHGKVVADIAKQMNQWESIVFLDDNEELSEVEGIEIIGPVREAYLYLDVNDVFVAIGNNSIRQKIQTELERAGASIPVLNHPKATLSEHVKIGAGSVIMAGAIINSSSTIGKGCIINTAASIDHDNQLGDYVHISPGVHTAGNVTIGQGSWLGIGSVISNNMNITDNCIIGAGAVVVNDISEAGTYVGVPARRI